MISEVIKEIRLQNNLSQQKLGGLLGVTQQAVAKWENNLSLPDSTSILAIYRIVGITPNELLGLEEIKNYKIKHNK